MLHMFLARGMHMYTDVQALKKKEKKDIKTEKQGVPVFLGEIKNKSHLFCHTH